MLNKRVQLHVKANNMGQTPAKTLRKSKQKPIMQQEAQAGMPAMLGTQTSVDSEERQKVTKALFTQRGRGKKHRGRLGNNAFTLTDGSN